MGFTVDHVIPRAQGGAETFENLALACFHCNRRKADRQTSVDPASGETVLLFNPRHDVWGEHFIWSADKLSIIGTTPVGRATVAALVLNRARVINIRTADRIIGRHPPPDDPIQEEGGVPKSAR